MLQFSLQLRTLLVTLRNVEYSDAAYTCLHTHTHVSRPQGPLHAKFQRTFAFHCEGKNLRAFMTVTLCQM